eukprot:gene7522-10246_t
MASSLTSVAIKNPMFQEAVKNAYFESDTEDKYDNGQKIDQYLQPTDESVINVDEEELALIRKWERNLRISMLIIATLMIITSWYNLFSSSVKISTSFLAVYLFFFSVMVCCFELAFRQVAVIIVQNFGFMYSAIGRALFLMFLAILCFQLSTMGKVMFGLLIGYLIVLSYVNCKHPQYNKYMRTKHYFSTIRAKPKSGGLFSTNA